MPLRITPLINDNHYHVFNRGVGRMPIFKSKYDYMRMIDLMDYYRFEKPPVRFSHYNRLNYDEKMILQEQIYKNSKELVEMYAFVLMPNHFHIQLKQLTENGISKFMGNFQNAYTKYFNTKHVRSGTLYELRFKAVNIESDEQVLHLNRYIHLNPFTSGFVDSDKGLMNYEWSSYPIYAAGTNISMINTRFVMDLFSEERDQFVKFTLDQVDYQKQLHNYKHLLLDL